MLQAAAGPHHRSEVAVQALCSALKCQHDALPLPMPTHVAHVPTVLVTLMPDSSPGNATEARLLLQYQVTTPGLLY